MRYSNFNSLLVFLNKETEIETALKKLKYTKSDALFKYKKILLYKQDEGTVLSYPNEELIEKQFVIRKKYRYNNEILLHRHDYIEATYVLKGSYQQEINGKTIAMSKGDFCILDRNTVHRSSYLDEQTIAVNLLFTAEFFEGIFLDLFTDSNPISNFIVNTLYSNNKERNYLIQHIEDNSYICHIIQRLLMEYFSEEMRSTAAIKGYLLILFTELSRLYSNTHVEIGIVNEKQHELKKKILQYIEDNFREINLNDLADHLHFHPTYLSSYIKKVFGKNLQDIVIETRMNLASKLLQCTDYSIEEIVSRSGYKNKSYFYKLFHKKYDLTPSEYRKQVKRSIG